MQIQVMPEPFQGVCTIISLPPHHTDGQIKVAVAKGQICDSEKKGELSQCDFFFFFYCQESETGS